MRVTTSRAIRTRALGLSRHSCRATRASRMSLLSDPVGSRASSCGQEVDRCQRSRFGRTCPAGAPRGGRRPSASGDGDDLLAGGQQRLLEAAGDRAAVLDRAQPLVAQSACPAHRSAMAGVIRAFSAEADATAEQRIAAVFHQDAEAKDQGCALMRSGARSQTIGVMRINLLSRRKGRRVERAGAEMAQTLSVASRMALFCPSGIDAWMRHELAAGVELPGNGSSPRP
jgi:hypothetical protein